MKLMDILFFTLVLACAIVLVFCGRCALDMPMFALVACVCAGCMCLLEYAARLHRRNEK